MILCILASQENGQSCHCSIVSVHPLCEGLFELQFNNMLQLSTLTPNFVQDNLRHLNFCVCVLNILIVTSRTILSSGNIYTI